MTKKEDRNVTLAETILDAVNVFGLEEDKVAKHIANAHRTLQQNVMRLCMAIIRAFADNYDKGYYDARNEATCRFAKKIVEASENDALPFI